MSNSLTGKFTEKTKSGSADMVTMSGFEITSLVIALAHLGMELWKFFFRDEPEKKPAPALALN